MTNFNMIVECVARVVQQGLIVIVKLRVDSRMPPTLSCLNPIRIILSSIFLHRTSSRCSLEIHATWGCCVVFNVLPEVLDSSTVADTSPDFKTSESSSVRMAVLQSEC
eukprot:Gregarina_sp_Poly_1__7537@NODE_4212_length_685_cov_25_825243_g2778_i0_p1_GENE_NODE_4212_length_685_cov_25_825243_g2778_i0NODE_4212_length_685_cov_25_825243_g2778_i0_p1_ORF_typecomplete_len108_score9_45_NODE_4212_length_685_cov_25_825243_g2778_i0242565